MLDVLPAAGASASGSGAGFDAALCGDAKPAATAAACRNDRGRIELPSIVTTLWPSRRATRRPPRAIRRCLACGCHASRDIPSMAPCTTTGAWSDRVNSTASCPFPTMNTRAPADVRYAPRSAALISSPSTTTKSWPLRSCACSADSPGRASTCSSTAKVLPFPGSLATVIRPPMMETRRLQIAKPNPLPPKRRVVETSACWNDWNRFCITSGGMPIPLSVTTSRMDPAARPSTSTRRSTLPRFPDCSPLNLIALPTRL